MMMENSSSSFQLSTTTTTESPNSHEHNIALQQQQQQPQQQQQQIIIKTESDYEYIDSGTASIVGHNCNRTVHQNDSNQQQEQQSTISANEQGHNAASNSSQYHLSGNSNMSSGNGGGASFIDGVGGNGSGGGGGGGGGGGAMNNNNNNHNNNNNVQQLQQSPISPSLQQQSRGQQQQNNVVNALTPMWHAPQQPPPQSQQQQQQQQQPPQQQQQQQTTTENYPANAFGMISHANDVLYITESPIVIGRNSSTSCVHFHVGKNSFVSRKHFQILYDQHTGDFYLICLSKNGVFVDDIFQRKSTEAMKLPKACNFRFPSTDIRIAFESFSDKTQEVKTNNKTVAIPNVIYSPLKITIPKAEQKSPYPSPTGTISAANSCPTSPRQGLEYHSYNYNNNNNFQNELFQPPSTSTYNEYEKPPYSYAQLIVQSISASPDKQLTLSGIYSFIALHYPYYRKEANKGWQNSIRHNLSLNRYFIKVARSQDEPGKGSFWRIDPNSEAKLIEQSYKKRRQRGSQCFRPSYGMPRSAPVSPSHIDNSRENSPIHDIVLQSAPGSPGVSYQNNHNENNHSGGEDVNNYSSQNLGQQQTYKYNNSSNYYHPTNNTTSTITSTSSTPLGPMKRHQTSSGSATVSNMSGHSDIYDEMGDYSGGVDSDECENTKRQKYATEMNQ